MSKPIKFIKGQLEEHYNNFVVVAIDEEGSLVWDYSNWMVALMLLERARQGIDEQDIDVVVTLEDDEDDEGGWEQEVPVIR
jgi:hypothetical protein